MHAVAVGWDWLYTAPAAVLSVADRATIADGLARRGLQITAEHWADWFFRSTINWNEVCNGGAIAASLVLLDSPVPAHKALAAAVLKNATHNIRLSEMSSYGPDGAWSEGAALGRCLQSVGGCLPASRTRDAFTFIQLQPVADSVTTLAPQVPHIGATRRNIR